VPAYWEPDTCPASPGCRLEITGGTLKADRLCAHHAAILFPDNDARVAHVVERNAVKNRAYNAAVEDLALAEGQTLPWLVDASGIFHITVGGNAQRKSRIQAKVDALVGSGLVVVE
jgi:hypothetical protein